MRIFLNERAPHPGNDRPLCYGTGSPDDEVCASCHYLPECQGGERR